MSVLSKILDKILPTAVTKSPVAEIGVAFIGQYVDVAKTEGRAGLERALTVPLADLQRLAPHADPAALQAADAAAAKADADLILLVAGVPG